MILITTPHQGVLLQTFRCGNFYFDRASAPEKIESLFHRHVTEHEFSHPVSHGVAQLFCVYRGSPTGRLLACWDRGALACERALMVFGFCGTGTLACAVGKEQVSCRRLSAVQQDALSSTIIFERARGSRTRVCEGRRAKGESKR